MEDGGLARTPHADEDPGSEEAVGDNTCTGAADSGSSSPLVAVMAAASAPSVACRSLAQIPDGLPPTCGSSAPIVQGRRVDAASTGSSTTWAVAAAVPAVAVATPGPSVDSSAMMDLELKWAIQESLRLSSAQQEAARAIPGAHFESGVVVPPDVGDATPLSSLEAEYANSARADLWTSKLRALSARYQVCDLPRAATISARACTLTELPPSRLVHAL
jgi:hypothetical protein